MLPYMSQYADFESLFETGVGMEGKIVDLANLANQMHAIGKYKHATAPVSNSTLYIFALCIIKNLIIAQYANLHNH
jgi:hypothetical protein